MHKHTIEIPWSGEVTGWHEMEGHPGFIEVEYIVRSGIGPPEGIKVDVEVPVEDPAKMQLREVPYDRPGPVDFYVRRGDDVTMRDMRRTLEGTIEGLRFLEDHPTSGSDFAMYRSDLKTFQMVRENYDKGRQPLVDHVCRMN